MLINEIFPDDLPQMPESQKKIYLDDLAGVSPTHIKLVKRLGRFHRRHIDYDPQTQRWFSDQPSDPDSPFIRDIKGLTSAERYGMAIESEDEQLDELSPSTVRKAMIQALAREKNDFRQGNMVRAVSTGKRIASVNSRLTNKEKNQVATEASMTKSVPSKKESQFHKGVDKLVGRDVAVVVRDYPDHVAYGVFQRIGETGLCHIKLNGGSLPGWASGDVIAVRPSEVYATWDTRLQGKTVTHREYDDSGRKINRT